VLAHGASRCILRPHGEQSKWGALQAEHGWKPLLYAETAPDGHVTAWVCYPQSAVRYWTSARASDPTIAVRALYLHALANPNEPPAPPRVDVTTVPGRVAERPDGAHPGVRVDGPGSPEPAAEERVAFTVHVSPGVQPVTLGALAALGRAAYRNFVGPRRAAVRAGQA
jgi:hypothetical protein